MTRRVSLLSAAFLALLGAGAAPSTPGPAGISGTYALSGTAHVSVSPFPAQDSPGAMTATLSMTPASGALSLHLEARGYGCTLQVRAAQDGSLQFVEGTTCPLDVNEPEARGHVEARLRTARGQAVDDTLELALEFDVKGSIQVKVPSKTIHIFGADLQTPATWAPSAPVRGTVAASGRGPRSPGSRPSR
jgi:hypothetical protein